MTTPFPQAVKLSDGWRPAFWDRWYQDYVIEMSWCRPTKEAIEKTSKMA